MALSVDRLCQVSSTLPPCSLTVCTTLTSLPTNWHPASDWLPKHFFRQITAPRNALSAGTRLANHVHG